MSGKSDGDSNTVLSLAVGELVKELRRKRRWGLFFKLVILLFVITMLLSLLFSQKIDKALREKPHVAVIRLDGLIAAGGPVDADRVTVSLQHAFADAGTRGVVLRINSPGGSPVQADDIYNEIMRLRKLHPKIPVYAVCADACASGAYFIAVAAQSIYANPSSLVGSIGVVMKDFGFVGLMQKLGITRRVIIGGKNKDFMDPYAPLTARDRHIAQSMVDDVHRQFIAAVEAGRGKRLRKTKDIFSGRVWTGVQAKKLGLIDAYGSADYVAHEVIKQQKMIDYTVRPSLIDRLADRLGMSMANVVMNRLDLRFDA